MYKIKYVLILALLTTSALIQRVNAQDIKSYNWSYIKMDSTFNPKSINKSGEIISKYKPTIDPLTETIGHTPEGMKSYGPESPLSNLAVDIIYNFANSYLHKIGSSSKVDIALTNFGGIRAELPKGDLTSFDILSIFPFDNKVVILDIKGKDIRELFEGFAKRNRVEVLSGVKLVIENKQIVEALIGGEEIDDNKIYKLATIDFLYGGGDGLNALKQAMNAVNTDSVLRDIITKYIKSESAAGRDIVSKVDGRVIIKK